MSVIEQAARLYVEAFGLHQRSVKRKSSRAAENERHMRRMHDALVAAVEAESKRAKAQEEAE